MADEAQSTTGSSGGDGEILVGLEHLRDVLRHIFDYYCVKASRVQERRLSSVRFIRMALDANLVDVRLTTAKVDLIFHQICGNAKEMSYRQFLEAIVKVACVKFPNEDANEALRMLYRKHFASFTDPAVAWHTTLETKSALVMGAARNGVQLLYEGYFQAVVRQYPVFKSAEKVQGDKVDAAAKAMMQRELQEAFVQVCSDFEVEPALTPSSVVRQVFRDIAGSGDIPVNLSEAVLGSEPNLGRHFTYAHFALGLALVAQRCFTGEGASSVVRLLKWMDRSCARLQFISKFPGVVNLKKANLRLMPETLPDGVQTLASPEPDSADSGARDGRQRSFVASTSSSSSTFRRPSLDAPESAAKRRLVQDVFMYYQTLGDPLNRSGMSSLKFNRFLRDIGALGSDGASLTPRTSALNSSSGFAPPDRNLPRAASSSALPVRRVITPIPIQGGSTGTSAVNSALAQPRHAVLGPPQGFSISRSPRARTPPRTGTSSCATLGLPLQVFSRPVLTKVDADLIFLHHLRTEDIAPYLANTSKMSARTRSASQPKLSGTGTKRHNQLCFDGFLGALLDVSSRCKLESEPVTFEDFCTRILEPLTQALLDGDDPSRHLQPALEFIRKDKERGSNSTLTRCRGGLERVFTFYAEDEGIQRRASWTLESLARFAQDFQIIPYVSYLPLQRTFNCCRAHFQGESLVGRGEPRDRLDFQAYLLALVLVAQVIEDTIEKSIDDKVEQFFRRLNICCPSLESSFPYRGAPLFAGVSKAPEGGTPRRRECTPPRARHASPGLAEQSAEEKILAALLSRPK